MILDFFKNVSFKFRNEVQLETLTEPNPQVLSGMHPDDLWPRSRIYKVKT